MKDKFDSLLKKSMWLALLAFVVRCFISWSEIKQGIFVYDLIGFAGEAIGISAIIVVVYEKYLWKIDPFEKTPRIFGMYSGTLKSNYDGKERKATLKIKQTLLTVEVMLKTEESTSRSILGTTKIIFGENELIYTYLNEPKVSVRNRSEIHYGTATFILDEKDILIGRYYTDRNTIGDMEFKKQNNKNISF